jgi:hypothetical protein
MKKTIQLTGLSIVILLLAGNIFKTFHLSGASILIVLSVFLFALIFSPLMIIKTINSNKKTIEKVHNIFANVLISTFICGVLFKIMNWPYANNLMFGSIATLIFAFIPFYFITKYKKYDLFETMVNTVYLMVFGGMLYTLFDLSNL